MKSIKRPVNHHKAYHAHIYFDEQTKVYAKKMCQESGENFNLKVGRFHEKLVGPHPCWSCQVIFGKKDFDRYVDWLEKNRNGLTILIHALTGDDLKDHTDFAYWLGEPVKLHLEQFR